MAANTDTAIAALEAAQRALDQGAAAAAPSIQPWSQELVTLLTLSVLGFSLAALTMSTALLWRSRAEPQQVLRVVGVLTIVAFSALLLVVGYSNEQLTPIVGLFGAIAGYLLGKDPKDTAGEQKQP